MIEGEGTNWRHGPTVAWRIAWDHITTWRFGKAEILWEAASFEKAGLSEHAVLTIHQSTHLYPWTLNPMYHILYPGPW